MAVPGFMLRVLPILAVLALGVSVPASGAGQLEIVPVYRGQPLEIGMSVETGRGRGRGLESSGFLAF